MNKLNETLKFFKEKEKGGNHQFVSSKSNWWKELEIISD